MAENFSMGQILDLVTDVGDNIVMKYFQKVDSIDKDDGSPVTIADKEASAAIIKGLGIITPDIPVVSEEQSMEKNLAAIRSSNRAWVTDPIDGTRSFLDGYDGFGVHVGLIENGVPVHGVAYFPAQQRAYFTWDDGKAYMQHGFEDAEQIQAHRHLDGPLRVAVPWKRNKPPETINGHPYEQVRGVGGEQVCFTAAGKVHLFPYDGRHGDTPPEERLVYAWWDVAAAHAVLKRAGGDMYGLFDGQPIRYNDDSLAVRPLVAGTPTLLKQLGFNINDGPTATNAPTAEQ